MGKILILFYSRSGRTKDLALKLKDKLNADIIEITDNINRKGFFGLLRTMKAELKKIIPEISPKDLPVENYDLVILGSPIWGGTLSTPMLKCYNDYKSQIKRTVIFFTCLGGLSGVGKDLVSEILKVSLEDSTFTERLLILTKREIKKDKTIEKIKKFTIALKT